MGCRGSETNLSIVSALLEEGSLKPGANLVSLLLLLLEVLFEFVRRETHFGLAAFVWGSVGPQPGALQTLSCSGSPPVFVSEKVYRWADGVDRRTAMCVLGAWIKMDNGLITTMY